MSADLDRFIDHVAAFDIKKFAASASAASSGVATTDVRLVGRFINGDQIWFSEFYTAVVFNANKEKVSEIDADKLSPGDVLVFAKRDDYTHNVVDYIYESLLEAKYLSPEVVDATDKAGYWKYALRNYRDTNHLTYREVAHALRSVGSTMGEGSVSQWLHEDSHIVGPREEKTLRQIAELTQDELLLDDTPGFFNACRIVRRQRRDILALMGKAIVDRLNGNMPEKESILGIVYENVDKLIETLELESIQTLDDSVAVPVNFLNRPLPIPEMEVSL